MSLAGYFVSGDQFFEPARCRFRKENTLVASVRQNDRFTGPTAIVIKREHVLMLASSWQKA
jgi:hypothetical protein